MSITRCEICYELKVAACTTEEITLSPALSFLTVYTVFLEDKFGNFHTQSVTTTGAGAFTLDLTAFDPGMFTAYSGSYELSVSTSEVSPTYETLEINSVSYPCVLLSFYNVD